MLGGENPERQGGVEVVHQEERNRSRVGAGRGWVNQFGAAAEARNSTEMKRLRLGRGTCSEK